MKRFHLLFILFLLSIKVNLAQDTLYIHQQGGLITKIAVNKIDSLTFHTPYIITDIDGNVYHTAIISTQTWMAENLKTTRFNDGEKIPLIADQNTWSYLDTPGYCYYNNDSLTYNSIYGTLYNWPAVNTGKLCPSGWHVPNDAEWTILMDVIGNSGSKLKEVGTNHWLSPNTDATNETGFTGLPGGTRYNNGYFAELGEKAYWWSSTEKNSDYKWAYFVTYNFWLADKIAYYKRYGFSVRCIKN